MRFSHMGHHGLAHRTWAAREIVAVAFLLTICILAWPSICLGICSTQPPTYVAQIGDYHTPGLDYCIGSDALGYIYVADADYNKVYKYSGSGSLVLSWGSLGSANGQFKGPRGITVDSSGNVYVTDVGNRRVQKFDSQGMYLTQWGRLGSGDGEFSGVPGYMCLGASNDIYVTESGVANQVQRFTTTGQFLGRWGESGSGPGQLNGTAGIVLAPDSTLYVVDRLNNRVQHFSAHGAYLGQWGSLGDGEGQLNSPYGIAISPDGCLSVVESNNNRISVFDLTGGFIATWGTYGSGSGQLAGPTGIAIFENVIYIFDHLNRRIQKFQGPAIAAVEGGLGQRPPGDLRISPNPVRPGASMQVFGLPEGVAATSRVTCDVFNVAGRLVATSEVVDLPKPVDAEVRLGNFRVLGGSLGAGIYMLRINAHGYSLGVARFVYRP